MAKSKENHAKLHYYGMSSVSRCTTHALWPIMAKLSISAANQMLSILTGSQQPAYTHGKGMNMANKV